MTLVKGEFLFAQRGADEVDVFLFPFGVGVAWGTNHLDAVVDELRGQLDALTDPWDQPLSETFSWQLGSDRDAIKGEVLHVAPHAGDAAFAIKLAFSAGLAQSIKLDSFEDEVDRLLGATEALPREIAKTGSLRMSSRDINRRIGQILQVRSDANLQYGLLDTPEFFWDLEASQNAYSSVARYLQVGRRTRVLNERLEVLKELFDLLREAKSSAYSHNVSAEEAGREGGCFEGGGGSLLTLLA